MPDGVDPATLATYCLMLGDDALVLSQRLAEWCSNAPDLEEDIALSNIALDLLGQARLLLARAAAADGRRSPHCPTAHRSRTRTGWRSSATPGSSATCGSRRSPTATSPQTVVRILLFSSWRLALLDRLLAQSRDAVLAAVAAKAVKELTYHRDFAGRWFLTLARGTDESRRRLLAGLDELWPLWSELFETHDVERAAAPPASGSTRRVRGRRRGGPRPGVRGERHRPAELSPPLRPRCRVPAARSRGRVPPPSPRDTRAATATTPRRCGELLAEMQVVARAHPRGQW